MNMSKLEILDKSQIESIISQAFEILDSKGVFIENESCLELLQDVGLNQEKKWVQIPTDLIEKSIKSVPKSIQMFDRDGTKTINISSQASYYAPGSTALQVLDSISSKTRPPTTKD